MSGWIKLHRKSLDSKYYSMGLKYIGMFDLILLKANWKKGYFRGRDIEPGSLGTSITGLAELLNEDRRTIRKILDDLQAFGMITHENIANQWTLITIVNWATYQQDEEDVLPTVAQPNDQRCPDGMYLIEEGKKEKKERKKEETDIIFPDSLQTEEFKTAWSEWLTFKKESKKKLTPSTAKRQLALLEKSGSANAVKMIQKSIENGWTGIFELKWDDAIESEDKSESIKADLEAYDKANPDSTEKAVAYEHAFLLRARALRVCLKEATQEDIVQYTQDYECGLYDGYSFAVDPKNIKEAI